MAEQQSSFIPKAPTTAGPSTSRTRKVYVLTYVSFVLFFVAVLATAIVFFLSIQANQNLNSQREQLDKAFAQFEDGSSLAEVRELSARLSEAGALLDRNISPVTIMAVLEAVTVKSVTIETLTLIKQESGEYLLELAAKAPHFNATQYQRELLTGTGILADAVITDVKYGTIDSEQGETDELVLPEEVVTFTISKMLTVDDIPHLVTPDAQAFSDTVETAEVAEEEGSDDDAGGSDDEEFVSALDAVTEAQDELLGDTQDDNQ